ncbi:MAG: ABC transporter permease [Candidatus Parabeggiatoa sp. nov. 3]|nr:MAG: ABC transporter permease [Gammaproteobacteria bacterium]RKZ59968.1 MAG: ABC transporter permease [Gammaproteobacteria bacterium]RKZ83064.1 MAG: ABC transporter permease [Gammaproteobacteria bacterium]HEW98434.1 ABC transporter permease [Beggiatoa sp.]
MMKLLTVLAWRNLWRYPRRTIIILFAIAIGVWSMLSLAAFMRGMMEQYVNNAIGNLVAHIQIHAPSYRDDPVIEHSMPPPTEPLLKVLNEADIKGWAARVRVPAVVSSERESIGVTLVGIDPVQEQGLSFIAHTVTEGRYLESLDDKGIILGRKLVERLETRLGKRVVLMSQNDSHDIAERGFRIVGVFDTKMEETETQFVFVGRQRLQKMLGMQDNISELAVLGYDRDNLKTVVQKLRAAAPEQDVEDWQTLNPLVMVIVNVFEGFLLIWYLVVFIAVAFGLVNTLLMAIFERTREMGLFQALGMKPRWIVGQVLFESLFLLSMGLIIGNLMSFATLLLTAEGLDFSRYAAGYEMAGLSSLIYPVLSLSDVVISNVLIIGLGLVASFYPAWRASRYVPVEAITRT